MKELAKKICQYNGQKGTEKQVEKCIKSFGGSIQLMVQFAQDRIDVKVEEFSKEFWNNLILG